MNIGNISLQDAINILRKTIKDDPARIRSIRKIREHSSVFDWTMFCLGVISTGTEYSYTWYAGKINIEPQTVRENIIICHNKHVLQKEDNNRKIESADTFVKEYLAQQNQSLEDAVKILKSALEDNHEKSKILDSVLSNIYNIIGVSDDNSNDNSECCHSNGNISTILNLFSLGINQIIIYGAPGTGKTYIARKAAEAWIGQHLKTHVNLCNNNEECIVKEVEEEVEEKEIQKRIWFVQFHPSYDYTDFVEGFRPSGVNDGQLKFELRDGIFKDFCKKALEDSKNSKNIPWVFVIDEINRAELSRVFGELMYAIESSYRGPKGMISTQYSGVWNEDFDPEYPGKFYVPENVYIIGTMNDIDRSVEAIDFALRRRFVWKEIRANDVMKDVINSIMVNEAETDESINIIEKKVESIVHVARELNTVIAPDDNESNNYNNDLSGRKYGLNRHYHIGPAYFLPLIKASKGKPSVDANAWETFWECHLEPLLDEYVRHAHERKMFVDACYNAYRKAYLKTCNILATTEGVSEDKDNKAGGQQQA